MHRNDDGREAKPKGRGKRNLLEVWPAKPGELIRRKSTAIISIPESFSFISDPHSAIETLTDLRRSIDDPRIGEIEFDHSECKSLDLCASTVMDVLFLLGQRQARFRGRKLLAKGDWSSEGDVNVLLAANGILKHLSHPISKSLPPDLAKNLRVFELRKGQRAGPSVTSAAEIASTDLLDFFNACLQTEGFHLNKQSERLLIDLVAEVLGNAEEHCASANKKNRREWYVIGYYKHSEREDEGGECHIVLFNFGDSIYESLRSPDTSPELTRQIQELSDLHRKRGFFDRVMKIAAGLYIASIKVWQEEALWTLYALQEGVSRFNHLPGNEDRGNGTVRMIEFFTDLASREPRMALISGRTWILFDGTYRLKTIMKQGGERKIIAFNQENDLKLPPDPERVRTLNAKFPGTLVSLKFRLRRSDLALIPEAVDQDAKN